MNYLLKKNIFLILFALPVFFNFSSIAQAFNVTDTAPPGVTLTTIMPAIDGLVDFVWLLCVGFGTIMCIVAGILFATAAGEAQQITRAKHALTYGIIGIIVGILGFSIVGILVRCITTDVCT